MAGAADTLADRLSGEDTDPVVDVDVTDEDVDADELEDDKPETDEVDEDELPEAVKAILKKNREAVRAAEKKARAAERALAQKAQADPEADEKADMYRGLLVKQAAKSEFLAAGLTGNADRFIKMLDLDEVEVADDGSIEGLEEQIEDIKADFPDLFASEKAPRKRAPRVSASNKDTPATKKSSADRLAAQLSGGR